MLSELVLASAIHVQPPEPPADSWQRALEEKRPCETTAKADYPWYDKAHLLLSDQVCQRALWFDNFFTAGEQLSEKQATSLLWVSLEHEWNERDGELFKPKLKGIIELPNTRKRLKLIIDGRDDSSISDDASDPTASGDERASAAFRFSLFDASNWDFDLDVGVKANSGPFTRGRARYYHAFNKRTVGTLTQDVVLELKELWFETTKFSLEHFSTDVAYRFTVRGKYGQESDGLEWGTVISRTDQLSKRAAMTHFLAMEGATGDEADGRESEIYRLGLHYRRSLWRPWFFFELEPQITFPRHYDYQATWQITAGIEVQMGKSRKRGFY